MHRLVLEFQNKDLQMLPVPIPLMKVKSLEILHFIRQDHQELAGICKIELKSPYSSIEDFIGRNKTIEIRSYAFGRKEFGQDCFSGSSDAA